ncbi:hypothetical protein BamMEX5DRAFT_5974 [Burkholderia ambifaria MEX-5]|uniref:Uncharacterized protein n=1 Tax=Burkholderia ambifaria MEX-5 TaxID=396597 RepID=B1TDV8_9BURK|nr:hypothetical protein BamMEX5DRAFT_5974 [Burkholderia ambifaria MEX-5]
MVGREIQREEMAVAAALPRSRPSGDAHVIGQAGQFVVRRHAVRISAGSIGDVVLEHLREQRLAFAYAVQPRARAGRQLATRQQRVADQVAQNLLPLGGQGRERVGADDGLVSAEQRGVLTKARQRGRYEAHALPIGGAQGRRIANRDKVGDDAPRVFERLDRHADRFDHVRPARPARRRTRLLDRVVELEQAGVNGGAHMERANGLEAR